MAHHPRRLPLPQLGTRKGDFNQTIDDFLTTKMLDTYKAQPFIMNATFSTIGTGIFLDPADMLVSYDDTWQTSL